MRTFLKYLLTAAALLPAVWSCKEEPKPIPEPDPEIKVTGVTTSITFDADASPRNFNVKANYAWVVTSSQDWLTVSPEGGDADEVVTVTATALPYEERTPREAVITIGIPDKDFKKEITVTQLGYDGPAKDSHAAGYVFFEDDFNWIPGIWPEKLKDSKWGWTSVKLDGTNYNEFSLSNGYDAVDAVFTEKGYTFYAENSTYCRYDGSLKLGRAAQVGYIATPALSKIDDAAVATLAVTFDASIYVATNGNPAANQYIKLAIVGEGTFKSSGTRGFEISDDGKTITVPVPASESQWKWVRKQVIVKDADKSTSIQFGVAEALDARSMLDNIRIERAADNATPAADAVQPAPALDKEIGTPDPEVSPASGGAGKFTVRVNRAWTATTTAEWLTFTNSSAGKSGDKYGNEISADGHTISICASELPYIIDYMVAESKVETARSAVVKISADGSEIGQITINQEAYVEPTKVDSHPAGTVLFSEDFSWITPLYDTASFSYWGWPSVKSNNAGGTNDQQISNAKNAAIATKFAELGWTSDATETYPRYEGYLRIGRAAMKGSVTTPAFSAIDAGATATVQVSFKTCMYASATLSAIDPTNTLELTVIGPGSIVSCGSPVNTIADDGKSAVVTVENDVDHLFIWNRKSFVVKDVTSETKICFGKSVAVTSSTSARYYLDDVVVTRVADNTTAAPADELVQDALSKEFTIAEGTVPADGGKVAMSLRANRAYTVTSDSDWIKIGAIIGQAEKGGVTIAEDKLSATVTRTGIHFADSYVNVSSNAAAEPRTGHITVTIEGETPVVLTVTQAAAAGLTYGDETTIAKWTFTALFSTFTHSDGKTYEAPSEAATSSITKWKAKEAVPSDVVAGGSLTAYHANSGSAHTGGTNTQVMNRMRFSKPTVGDYFLFTLSGLNLAAQSKVAFKNGYISGTNGDKSPGEWTEEYSTDGTNWTKVQDLKVKKANPTTVDDATFMDCEFTLPEAVSGTLYFRVRISTNNTINSKTFDDSTNDLVFIGVDPAISTSSFSVRLKLYEADKDYLTFTAKQPL